MVIGSVIRYKSREGRLCIQRVHVGTASTSQIDESIEPPSRNQIDPEGERSLRRRNVCVRTRNELLQKSITTTPNWFEK